MALGFVTACGSAGSATTTDAGVVMDARPDARPEADAKVPVRNTLLDTIAEGSALDLGQYECREESGYDNCGTISDFGGFVYDSQQQQMLMFGGGHSATSRNDVAVFGLDSLAWNSAYPPNPCSSITADNYHPHGEWKDTGYPISLHTYDGLIYFPNTNNLFVAGNYAEGQGARAANACLQWALEPGGDTRAHLYDPIARTWRASSVGPLGQAAELDPTSGRGVIVTDSALFVYDAESDTVETFSGPASNGWQGDGSLTYVPGNDRFYYISTYDWRVGSCPDLTPPLVIEISIDRESKSYTRTNLAPTMGGEMPDFGCGGSGERGFAFDPKNGELVTVRNGAAYAFDPLTQQWRVAAINSISEDGLSIEQRFFGIAYDPTNEVFIVHGGANNNLRTWAYRHYRN